MGQCKLQAIPLGSVGEMMDGDFIPFDPETQLLNSNIQSDFSGSSLSGSFSDWNGATASGLGLYYPYITRQYKEVQLSHIDSLRFIFIITPKSNNFARHVYITEDIGEFLRTAEVDTDVLTIEIDDYAVDITPSGTNGNSVKFTRYSKSGSNKYSTYVYTRVLSVFTINKARATADGVL